MLAYEHNDTYTKINYDNDALRTNYEYLNKVVNNEAVKTLFRNSLNKKDSNTPKFVKDEKGFIICNIPANTKIYKGLPWFYSTDKCSNTFCNIYDACHFALLCCGGIHTYDVTKNCIMLVVNEVNINIIIFRFLDYYIKDKKQSINKNYFIYIKTLFTKGCRTILEDLATCKFLLHTSKALGYQGLYYPVLNRNKDDINFRCIEIIFNNCELTKKTTDVYDWSQWKIKDGFFLDNTKFDLNSYNYSNLNKTFTAYRYYLSNCNTISNMIHNFGLINVDNFISINKLHSSFDCINGIIDIINKNSLKFICICNYPVSSFDTINEVCKSKGYNTYNTKYPITVITKEGFSVTSTKKTDVYYCISFTLNKNDKYRYCFLYYAGTSPDELKLKIDEMNAHILFLCTNMDYKYTGNKYVTNTTNIKYTCLHRSYRDFILTKMPLTLKSCVAVNYLYSGHKVLLGS